jgi:hypothetical protein
MRSTIVAATLLLCASTALARSGPVDFYLVPKAKALRLEAGPDSSTGGLLSLLPTLEVQHGRRRWSAPFVTQALEMQGGRIVLRAQARGATLEATLELSRAPRSPELQLQITRRYRRAVAVRREVLSFEVPPAVTLRAVDRSYRLVAPKRRLLAGVAAPVALLLERKAGRIAFYGSPSLPRALWRPTRRRLELELDHRQHHPLRVFERCQRRLRAFPPPRRDLSTTPRRAGEVVQARGRFVLAPRLLTVAQRYPHGFKAALSLTDHADQSSAAKLEAFAFGASGALQRGEVGPKHPGFVNRGLRYTKTIFLAKARAYDRQFDDPGYRKILAALQRAGSEIGVHSPTGGRDTPRRTRELLGAFASAYRGRNWIDHQPYTNCEALSMNGLDRRSPWFVLGELARAGFRYVWTVPDVGLRRGSLNMLRGRRPAARRAAIYYHRRLEHQGARLIGFRSAMLFAPRRRFLSRFSPRAVARLVAERGLLIGHVYLDSHRPSGSFANKTLLRRDKSGRYHLRAEVDALFVRLAALQKKRALWVTGVEALADHLLAARALTVTHRADGKLALGKLPDGLTLRVWSLAGAAAKTLRARVDGKPAVARVEAGSSALELTLAKASKGALLEVLAGGRAYPVSEAATLAVKRR